MPADFRPPFLGGSGRGSARTSAQLVSMCHKYTTRLKERPLSVKLHVSPGTVADAIIAVEMNDGGKTDLVVKSKGSTLFGLVKKERLHTFSFTELQRPGNPTAALFRSVNVIVKGDEAAKEEMLARSLSLIQKSEAVEITFKSPEDHDHFCGWLDAKWSVAQIQKSFRRSSPRIDLALQGRNQSLDEQGLYSVLQTARDEAEEPTLPLLDRETLEKLQDDLLNGVHVYYHDKSFQGFNTMGAPRRLRYDCLSEDKMIVLEPSFEGEGTVIQRTLDDLVQIGGGPSAHSLTTLLLRNTIHNPEARSAAVSLVFNDVSMDMTLGSQKDAEELVLYFSEMKNFRRAAPRTTDRSPPSPIREYLAGRGGRIPPPLPKRPPHEAAMDALEEGDESGVSDPPDPSESAMRETNRVPERHRVEPPQTRHQDGGHSAPSELSSQASWSRRYTEGIEGPGDVSEKAALRRDMSAWSTFSAVGRAKTSDTVRETLSPPNSRAQQDRPPSYNEAVEEPKLDVSLSSQRARDPSNISQPHEAPLGDAASRNPSDSASASVAKYVSEMNRGAAASGGGGGGGRPGGRRSTEVFDSRWGRPIGDSSSTGKNATRRATTSDASREVIMKDLHSRAQPRSTEGSSATGPLDASREGDGNGRSPVRGPRVGHQEPHIPGDDSGNRHRRFSLPAASVTPYRGNPADQGNGSQLSSSQVRTRTGTRRGPDDSPSHHSSQHSRSSGPSSSSSGGAGVGGGNGQDSGKPRTLKPVTLTRAISPDHTGAHAGGLDTRSGPRLFAPQQTSPTSRYKTGRQSNAVPFATSTAWLKSRREVEGGVDTETPLTRSDHEYSRRRHRNRTRNTVGGTDVRSHMRSASPVDMRRDDPGSFERATVGVDRRSGSLFATSAPHHPVQLRARTPPRGSDGGVGLELDASDSRYHSSGRSPSAAAGAEDHSRVRLGKRTHVVARTAGTANAPRTSGYPVSPPPDASASGFRLPRSRFSTNPGGSQVVGNEYSAHQGGQNRPSGRRVQA